MTISREIIYMMVSTLCASLLTVCIKIIPRIPTNEIVLFRILISFVICYISLKKLNISLFGKNKKVLLMRGASGTIALLLYFYTLQKMPLATAVTLQYISPIFATIFAAIFLKEHFRFQQLLFFIISFSGVILIKSFEPAITYFLLIIALVSALASGIAYTCIRKLKHSDHPLVIVLYFSFFGLPVIGPYTYFNWVQPTLSELAVLILIGVLAQVAQYYMTKSYQGEKMANISIFKYFGLIYALFFGYFIFAELITYTSFLGIFLIILGLIFNIKFKS